MSIEQDEPPYCERCEGTGDMTIHERAVGINAGIGIPDGQWFSWKDTCKECGGTGLERNTESKGHR